MHLRRDMGADMAEKDNIAAIATSDECCRVTRPKVISSARRPSASRPLELNSVGTLVHVTSSLQQNRPLLQFRPTRFPTLELVWRGRTFLVRNIEDQIRGLRQWKTRPCNHGHSRRRQSRVEMNVVAVIPLCTRYEDAERTQGNVDE